MVIETPPPKGTDARRREIAAAALRCLRRHGQAGLTARRVAAEAGLSLGHLTYNFAGMEEIAAAAWTQAVAEMSAPGPLPGTSPAERLEAHLLAAVAPDAETSDRLRLRIELWAAARTNPALAAIEADLATRERAQIEALLTEMADPWKADRIAQVAEVIVAALDGLRLDRARRGESGELRTAAEGLAMFARLRLG